MMDTVVNHMAYFCGFAEDGNCGPQGTIDYSIYNPFNSESFFHPFCEINYNNATSIIDVGRPMHCFGIFRVVLSSDCSAGRAMRLCLCRPCGR